MNDKRNNLVDLLVDDINKIGSMIFPSFLSDDHLSRIPESLFVNYFLPRFIGEIEDERWTIDWVSIANTPMAEVIVFDDRTREPLFKVPPLFNTKTIFINKKGSIGDMFALAQNMSVVSLQRGFDYVVQETESIVKEVFPEDRNDEYYLTWYNILRRYNKLPELTQSNPAQQDDLFEY